VRLPERLQALLGVPVCELDEVRGGGYSTAFRARAELADGRTAFVKMGAAEPTSSYLRLEGRFYESVSAPFMPVLLAFDGADPPLLVLEDLGAGRWPPPWDEASIDAVRTTLAAVAATPPPAGLPRVEEDRESLVGGWAMIERDPDSFLSLRCCSSRWLEGSLPALQAAAEGARIEGDALLHLDVRSDNICLAERGAVLVDWNWACVGNPRLDLAAWLPSLCLEGGPEPSELLPDEPGFAALLAGFFGARAGLPPPETAPHVRPLQEAQLGVALRWAAQALELPEPRPEPR